MRKPRVHPYKVLDCGAIEMTVKLKDTPYKVLMDDFMLAYILDNNIGITIRLKYKGKPYVIVGGKKYLHQIVLPADKGLHIDHINNNSLDNRLSNLRIATPQQNQFNRKSKNIEKHGFKWRVYFRIDNVKKYFGSFDTESEALERAEEVRQMLHGEFAYKEEKQ